jgi:alanine dehydrogenase
VGAGAVAVGAVRSMNVVGQYGQIKVWSRKRANAEAFVKRLENQFKFQMVAVDTVKEAADTDIIITSTLATSPVVEDAWIREGTHIAALGADMEGKQELEGKLLKRARIFVDDMGQCVRDGEINVPLRKGEITMKDVTGTIGEVIAGKKPGRLSDRDITIFDSTGIALQDAAVITLEYQRAMERGVGTKKRMVGKGYVIDF